MSRRRASRAAVPDPDTIGRVRRICADLPECHVDGDQHQKLSVRGKTMGWHTVDHHGDGRIALTLKAARGENVQLVASDPHKFFMPPYMAHHGYVGVYLDIPEVDWEEIRELIVDAYRLAAPKALVKLIE
jgi:hypothetical protein